jgi:colanic acid/amylovoran biosynthesis glycosyltransferase
MRVAFFMNGFPVLSQTFILNQVTGLLDRGLDVDIYAGTVNRDAVMHGDVAEYGLMGRVRCFGEFQPQVPRGRVERLMKAPLVFVRNRKALGPLFRSADCRVLGWKAASMRYVHEAARFVGRGLDRYDIVHCHFGPNGILCALLKNVGLIRGRLLTTFYGYDVTRYPRLHGPGVYRLLFQEADAVLVLSHLMKRQLMDLGCPEDKITVHRLGVDLSRFSHSSRGKCEDGSVRLFTPCRLVEKKGLEYGIRAVARLARTYPALRYRIAGDGPLRSELEALIQELQAGEAIEILGWRAQDEVIELLNDADILLAPSVTAADGDEEGTPTVLIEALAQGIPVVSTYHSGIPEVVEDMRSGFLVPERDVDALANRIEALVRQPGLRGEMGIAGRRFAESHFDIDRLNDRLVMIYRQLSRELDPVFESLSVVADASSGKHGM